MKRLITLLYFSFTLLLSVNVYATNFSQVSSTCVESLTITTASDGTKELVNGTKIAIDDTYTLQIVIPEADKVVLKYINTTLGSNGGNKDGLKIYKNSIIPANLIKDYTNSNAPTTNDTILTGRVYLVYTNGANNLANFKVTWQGLLSYSADITNVTCHGLSTGEIQLNTNYTGSTINWYNNDTDPSSTSPIDNDLLLNNQPKGNYKAIIGSSLECYLAKVFTITEPEDLTAVVSDIIEPCYNETNGQATLKVSGGSTPYTLNWNSTGNKTLTTTDTLLSNLDNVTYNFQITDAKGCPYSSSQAITQNSQIVVTIDTTDYNGWAVSCFNGSNGTITLNSSGGSGSFTYLWGINTGYQTTKTAINLKANTYNYTVTDAINCTQTGNIQIHAPNAIVINEIIDSVSYYGYNDGKITVSITNATNPKTLTWTGTGVVQNSLTQSNLYAGLYALTVTDANSCTATESYTVNQRPKLDAGVIAIGGASSKIVCEGESSFNFTETTAPSGGDKTNPYTFKWEYSTTNNNPWIEILGETDPTLNWVNSITTDTYIRRITNDGSTTATTSSILLDLIPAPTLTISNLNSSYCYNNSEVTLIGFPTNSNGVFTGNGIVSSTNGLGQFLPSHSSIDTTNNPVIITYTYTDNGCVTTKTASTVVNTIPSPDFSLPTKRSKLDPPLVITDGFPTGGLFSGPGMTPEGTLYASGLAEGPIDITYTVANNLGCSNTKTKTTRIIAGAGLLYTDAAHTQLMDEIFCYDGAPFTIFVDVDNNFASGYFDLPVTDNGVLQGWFDPSAFKGNSDNIYTVKYNYSGTDGNFSIEKEITVINITTEAKIANLNASYCNYGQEVTINANPLKYINDKGEFTGYGITDASTSDATAQFDVNTASGFSNPIKVKYTYTHGTSGCIDMDSAYTNIIPKPDINFNLPIVYNADGKSETLKASPKGGSYTPAEYFINDSIFVPSKAPVGDITIAYSVSVNGCTNQKDVGTRVEKATGKYNNLNPSYCYSDSEITFSVSDLTNPATAIGVFTGEGVTNLGNNQASFNPRLAFDNSKNPAKDSSILVLIEFEYKGIDDSTLFKLQTTTRVRNNGEITIKNLNATRSYCSNHSPVTLSAVPANGIFSGIGMNGDVFSPALVGGPQTTINYTYTDTEVGCTITKDELITILDVPSPTISFNAQLCSNSLPDTVIGYPRGGVFSVLLPYVKLFNINDPNYDPSAVDSIKITPSADYIGSNQITYTYTNPANSCVNSVTQSIQVDTIPKVEVVYNTANAFGFCLVDNPVNIIGMANDMPASTGIFTGAGIADPTQNNGKGVFNPILAGVGTHPNTFTYTASNGCVNKANFITVVNPVPDVSLAGLNDEKVYCGNHNGSITLTGAPASGTTQFTIDIEVLNTSVAAFTPSKYSLKDSVQITYYNKTDKECENSISKWVTINDYPNPNFDISNVCIADSIKFTYLGGWPVENTDSVHWDFGDGKGSNELNPIHKYEKQQTVDMIFYIRANNGCYSSNIRPQVNLEDIPDPVFTWFSECVGDNVKFNSESSQTSFNTYAWDFGDGTSSNQFEPTHTYPGVGKYAITRTIASNALNSNCISAFIDTIHIRPIYTVDDENSYIESFEENNGYWIPENLSASATNYTWEHGEPAGKIINSAPHGNKIYATNLAGNYLSSENSALTSPCFILSDLNRPMISLGIIRSLDNNRDGAAIEYTRDGETWELLGNYNEGINWYNSPNIYTWIGNQNKTGWTDTTTMWQDCRIDMDALKNSLTGRIEDTIRFRIAFASDNALEYEGIGVDNFSIVNRTRKVLVEHFTNTENNTAVNSDRLINTLSASLPLDAIDIQYHTSFNTNDAFYKDYPAGATTRESFYNLTKIPYSITDGTVNFDYSNSSNQPTTAKIKSQSLINPLFNMQLNVIESNDQMEIGLNIQALETINNRSLLLYVAIVEKAVTLNSNSQLVFENVLRRFLPSPGGKYLSPDWSIDAVADISYNYTYNNYIDNKDTVIVVAFIQDEKTKEILQTVTNDYSTISTAIEPWLLAAEELDFIVYPNPANEKVYLAFGKNTKPNSQIQIFTQTGELVHASEMVENSLSETIATGNLTEGVYIIRWVNGEQVKNKKLIIVH